MLAVNFLEPHAPNQSCRDEQYDPNEVYLPDNWRDWPVSEEFPAFLRESARKVAESMTPEKEQQGRE